MHASLKLSILAAVLVASGCAAGYGSNYDYQYTTAGTVTGALIGGVLGHQIDSKNGRYAGAATGALIGGMIGNNRDQITRQGRYDNRYPYYGNTYRGSQPAHAGQNSNYYSSGYQQSPSYQGNPYSPYQSPYPYR